MIGVRFALAPAGHLPIGAARVAVANFLYARRYRGEMLLRFDDTERERCRPEFEDSIAHDLQWLGITWDRALRQSDRLPLYAEAIERLKRNGRLYPCFESEEELRAKREQRVKRGQAPVYDRAMLELTPTQRALAESGGKRPYWRFLLSDTTVYWHDTVLGGRAVKLPAVSDPILVRADGTPLPLLTSVVDDIDLGITQVIRAEEHITATAVQLDLFTALGADPSRVRFAHLPPLTDGAGERLSKRIATRTVRSLRNDGVEAAALAAYLAGAGTSLPDEPVPLRELAERFDLSEQSPSAVSFDAGKLLELNRAVLRRMPFASVASRLPSGATEAFWLAVRDNLDLLTEARGWWDVIAGTIVPPVIEGEQATLIAALELLPPEPWNGSVWGDWVAELGRQTGRDAGSLHAPLQLALTGEDRGPPLDALLPLMGRTRAAHRLRTASA